jgi:hypothetical protein
MSTHCLDAKIIVTPLDILSFIPQALFLLFYCKKKIGEIEAKKWTKSIRHIHLTVKTEANKRCKYGNDEVKGQIMQGIQNQ